MVQWHLDFHHFPYVSNYLIVLLYGDLTTQKSDLVLCEVKFRLLNIVYRDQSSVVAVTNMEMWRIMIIHKHRDNNSIKSTYFRHYSIHLYLCKHNLFSLHVQAFISFVPAIYCFSPYDQLFRLNRYKDFERRTRVH